MLAFKLHSVVADRNNFWRLSLGGVERFGKVERIGEVEVSLSRGFRRRVPTREGERDRVGESLKAEQQELETGSNGLLNDLGTLAIHWGKGVSIIPPRLRRRIPLTREEDEGKSF